MWTAQGELPSVPKATFTPASLTLSQVSSLDSEGLLGLRPVRGRFLEPTQLVGRDCPTQPAQIRGDPRVWEVWKVDQIGAFLDQSQKFFVHILVSDAMGERVDSRPEEALGILEREDVCRDL